MPRIAICFSGFIRSYEKYFESIKNLFNEDTDTYFYGYKHDDDTDEYVSSFIRDYNFKKYVIKNYSEEFLKEININPSILSVQNKNTLSMFYNIYKCNELIDENYDLIIRARTDIIIKDKLNLNDINEAINNKAIIIPSEWCYKSVNPHAVTDTFAVGHPEPMNIYSNLIKIVNNSTNLHPESLLGTHLHNNNVNVILKDNWIYDLDNARFRKTKKE